MREYGNHKNISSREIVLYPDDDGSVYEFIALSEFNLTSNLSKEQSKELLFYQFESTGLIESRIRLKFNLPIINGKRPDVYLV
jgi:hypothetical protein